MRGLLGIAFLLVCLFTEAQTDSLKYAQTTIFKLTLSDSAIYYQCRVVPADITVKTTDGSYTATQQTITVTEKFVVYKGHTGYRLRHYISGFTNYPNRKFSGLKLKERDYWKFVFQNEQTLSEQEVLFLAILEQSGKPTTEYDFAITKYTTNQVIIRYRKNFEQLLPSKNVSVSKALNLTRN